MPVNITYLVQFSRKSQPLVKFQQQGWKESRAFVVIDVSSDSILSVAGIRPHDVILKVNGNEINSPLEFATTWAQSTRNQPVSVEIWRNQRSGGVTLGEFPGAVLSASKAKIIGTAFFDEGKNYIGRWTNQRSSLQWNVNLEPNSGISDCYHSSQSATPSKQLENNRLENARYRSKFSNKESGNLSNPSCSLKPQLQLPNPIT